MIEQIIRAPGSVAADKAISVITNYRNSVVQGSSTGSMVDAEKIMGRPSSSLLVKDKIVVRGIAAGMQAYWDLCKYQSTESLQDQSAQLPPWLVTGLIAIGGIAQTFLIAYGGGRGSAMADKIAQTRFGGVDWNSDWPEWGQPMDHPK